MTTFNVLRKNRNRVRQGQLFQFDYWLALTVAGLVVLGILMVYSTTFDLGQREYDRATYYIERQLLALAIGAVGAVILMRIDYHGLRRFSVPMLFGTVAMLLAVLLIGDKILGARRGLIAGSVQPSEIAKLVMIMYIAHWLSSKGDRVKNLTYGLLPFSILTGAVCALIVLQPDLGTAILIAGLSFALFFIAGADLKQIAFAGTVGGAIFFFLVTTLPHAAQRIESFKVALQNPLEAGWHVKQAVVALGTGGWLGVGLGKSTQKFGPLPAAHTDGVFAILGEELGLLGCMLLISAMAVLIWRGIRTALSARDSYGFLLAIGITCWLGFQALINLGVIVAVLPFTGMPLPFLSYGGSSIAITLFGIGILLGVSRDAMLDVKVQGSGAIRESMRESINLRRRNRGSHLPGTGRGR